MLANVALAVQTAPTNVKKRTKQLDGDKEVLLFTLADGTPVWTSRSELSLTGEQLEEKAAKQATGVRLGNVQEVVNSIRSVVNDRLEMLIQQLAPNSVIEQGEHAVAKWMQATGFHIFRRDLTWHVHVNGRAVLEMPIFVAPSWRADVLALMASEERAASGGNGQ